MTSREFRRKEAQLFSSLTEQHGHSCNTVTSRAIKAALMQEKSVFPGKESDSCDFLNTLIRLSGRSDVCVVRYQTIHSAFGPFQLSVIVISESTDDKSARQ